MAAFTTTLAVLGLSAMGLIGAKKITDKGSNEPRTRSGSLGPRGSKPAPEGAEIVGKAVPRGTTLSGEAEDTPPSTAASASASAAAAGLAGERARKRAQAGSFILNKNSSGGAANPRANLAPRTLIGGGY